MSESAAPAASAAPSRSPLALLALAALGVVYGDIGTSPLYAMKEAFGGADPLPVTATAVLGVLSLIFWSLIMVVTVKYVIIMVRADNRGEGGIMALMALLAASPRAPAAAKGTLLLIGLFGAALFYGDAAITPAISVLSAVEGLEVLAPGLHPYVVPVAVAVLLGLFLLQQRGTAGIGAVFGPAMLVWFATLALLGLVNVARHPDVLAAVNPVHAVRFAAEYGVEAYLSLGAVVLVITGAEALYADMGHFGKTPIRLAWSAVVLPALTLNYFGQGALLLANAEAVRNPFYLLAPAWALVPLIVLATLATVIASQAVISGTFSVTRQAIQLSFCPRLDVQHTSEREIGQVFLPRANLILGAAVIALVLGFQSSTNLASAYGIAVTSAMAIDSVLLYFVARYVWRWPAVVAGALSALLLAVDLAFVSANLLKILDGGWFPLGAALALFTLFATWYRGRRLLMERISDTEVPLLPFIKSLEQYPPTRVPGSAVFLVSRPEGVPHALLHNLAHNKVLHDRVFLLTVVTEDRPHVPDADRLELEALEFGFHRLTVRYGFKDEPDIPAALALAAPLGVEFNLMETTFFLSRETLIPTVGPGMALWRERLFALMARNAGSATAYFRLPVNRVVELGTQIEL
ncbi:MAG TPA: potassium transporter Kup [Pelomicrobium sp.]|nr:potassium transporter Kup [Pelomicrobium sp.]